MRKMFIKYLLIVIAAAMVWLILINDRLTESLAGEYALREAKESVSEMIDRMESNEAEIAELYDRLSADYLTRLRAFRYMTETDSTILTDSKRLKELSIILDVDEIHVIDRTGFITASSIDEYIGYDMLSAEQSNEFLSLFDDPGSELVQSIQPNGAEGRELQYVGLTTADGQYILQVGMLPERTLQALKKNDLSNFISNSGDNDKNLFIINMETGRYEDNSDSSMSGGLVFSESTEDVRAELEKVLNEFSGGGYYDYAAGSFFVYITEYDGKMVGVAYNTDTIKELLSHTKIRTIIYVTLTFAVMLLLIVLLVDMRIVKHIRGIINDLESISKGDLERSVNDKSLPEFEKLSTGINTMKNAVISSGSKITGIIGAMNVPIAVYEVNYGTEECTVIGNIQKLFRLSDDEKNKLLADKNDLLSFVSEVMSNPEDGEEDVYRLNGSDGWVKIDKIPTANELFCIITDATDFIREKRQIVSERDRDALTGIYNRRCFERKVSMLMEKEISGISAMLMIDLDNFKAVNDNFGHAFGDEYLKFTADCLKTFADENVIVGRRSGDEFYMYLFDFKDKNEINKAIGAVYAFIGDNYIKTPDNSKRTVAFSAGAAVQAEGVDQFDELLNAADEMLYKAKNEHKGSFVGV